MKITEPKKYAGGWPAILSSMKISIRQMGLWRTLTTLLRVNQDRGFDCPGCAWPDPEDRSTTEFCENGAKAVAEEAMTKKIGPDFFARLSIDELREKSDYWLGQQGRLTTPMYKAEGASHYQEISWDEAFVKMASVLREMENPNEASFYTSGRTSNEAAFLYQLFVRCYGTNNLPDCSNLCHESSGVALGETLGVGKGTVQLEDFDEADLIFVIGQNPGTNHPRMLSHLQEAARRGCKIVSINPLPEAATKRFVHPQEPLAWLGSGTPLETVHLPVRINGDVAVLRGLCKYVLENDGVDLGFVQKFTHGFEEFAENAKNTSWSDIEKNSGLTKKEIESVGQMYLESEKTIACWAMGLTQHENAVANIQEVVNLMLLRGNVGRPGAGLCPVRGHSNVQGDRTMGIYEKPNEEFLLGLEKEFSIEMPRAHGMDVVESIQAMLAKKVRFFFAMGGNFLSASPDTEKTAEALSHCQMTVQVSTKLNRSHLHTGREALILPCLGRTEVDGGQFVTVENSMSIVHRSEGKLRPASKKLKSEVRIVSELASKVLDDRLPWLDWSENYDLIRDRIAGCIPGFANFNQRVREKNGFMLPNAARERVFNTVSKKAEFTVHALPKDQLAEGRYWLTTLRSHDQYNTTIYGLDDRYRGIYNARRIVLMNVEDMKERGLKRSDKITLCSHFQNVDRRAKDFAVIPYAIPRRCLAAYFPEANALVPLEQKAHKSNTPASKSIEVSLEF